MIANKTNLTEIKPIYILQEPKLVLFPCSQFTKRNRKNAAIAQYLWILFIIDQD